MNLLSAIIAIIFSITTGVFLYPATDNFGLAMAATQATMGICFTILIAAEQILNEMRRQKP
jgi:hypothetical protein